MLRKLSLSTIAACAAVMFVAMPAMAQKQTLKMAYFWGPKHHMLKSQEGWIKTVEKASNGNLSITMDKAGIGGPRGQYDLVKNGVRDMVWYVPAYTPGRFPLYQAADLPLVCPNATICSPALWEWYAAHDLEKREYKDTKLVVAFTHGPGMLHAKRPIRTLAELAGVKVRAGGANAEVAKALGAAVVALPANEAYEAIQRGTAEAVLFPWEAMISFRLNEVATFHLAVPGGFYAASFGININRKSFANLSAANQNALMEAGGLEGSKLLGKYWDAADARSRKDAVDKGNIIETLAPAEVPKWVERLLPIQQDWIDNTNKMGLDGKALLDDFKARVRKYSS